MIKIPTNKIKNNKQKEDSYFLELVDFIDKHREYIQTCKKFHEIIDKLDKLDNQIKKDIKEIQQEKDIFIKNAMKQKYKNKVIDFQSMLVEFRTLHNNYDVMQIIMFKKATYLLTLGKQKKYKNEILEELDKDKYIELMQHLKRIKRQTNTHITMIDKAKRLLAL